MAFVDPGADRYALTLRPDMTDIDAPEIGMLACSERTAFDIPRYICKAVQTTIGSRSSGGQYREHRRYVGRPLCAAGVSSTEKSSILSILCHGKEDRLPKHRTLHLCNVRLRCLELM